MKRNILAAVAFVTCMTLGVKAQSSQAETQRLNNLAQQLAGTYQVQVIDSREYFSMPLSMMDSIATKRNATETTYIWLKSNTRIMVPPASVISQPGFKPLERVVYITSKEK